MSHVDEGALHAYLDGALDEYPASEAERIRGHLGDCAECSARLEDERAIRRQARSILELAAPEVEVPSFEELRAYVRATRPAADPKAVRLYRLGWAASIVLALGVGWMARGGQLDRAPMVREPELSGLPAAELADAEALGADGVTAPMPDVERLRPDGFATVAGGPVDFAEAAAERQLPAESPAVVESLLRRTPAATGEAGRSAAPADDRSAVVEAASAGVSPEEALDAPAAVVAEADVPGLLDSLGPPDAPARPTGAEGEGARIADLSLDPLGPVGDTVVTTPLSSAVAQAEPARAEEEARRRAPEREAALAAIALAPSVALGVGRAQEDATEEDAEAPLIVPDVPVVSFANLAEGKTPGGLHILQRLDSGEILDVYHLPEGIDLSVLPPLEDGRNEVRAQREGGWVILRAVAPMDTLRELLARLDPGR